MRAYEQVQYVVENNRAAGTDEQQLIYEGGYEQLFGEISMKGRLIGELLCVLVAVYSAAGLLGMEYDLKVMNLLQSTKKGRGTLLIDSVQNGSCRQWKDSPKDHYRQCKLHFS